MNVGKVANFESLVSDHCTNSLECVLIMKTSCFSTDFASQMKLTKRSLNSLLPLSVFFSFKINKKNLNISGGLTTVIFTDAMAVVIMMVGGFTLSIIGELRFILNLFQ